MFLQFCFKCQWSDINVFFKMAIKKLFFPVAIMPIDNMPRYARIGVYYSNSRNSLCNYTRNFKISFSNKNCAVALIVFSQYFLVWISFLGEFLRNSYCSFLCSYLPMCKKFLSMFLSETHCSNIYAQSRGFIAN